MAAEYLERHAKPNKRSWREDARRIRKTLLPAFGPCAATTITRADIRTLLDKIVERPAPSEAIQTHALLRTMYNLVLSDIESSWPSQNAHPLGGKLPAKILISDINGSDNWMSP